MQGLFPRGLPLGELNGNVYQEGTLKFEKGDTLILYSDGLIDARPELALNNQFLSEHLAGAASAQEMVVRLMSLTEQQGQLPDDVTVLVAHCLE